MRKIIASMNITLDGFCDHTAGVVDDELHDHYTALLNSAGTVIYGRTTYQLMESYWPALVATPSGDRSADDFALSIDNIEKIVYSTTLKSVSWKNTVLKSSIQPDEVLALKQQPGKNILVGSPSLIAAFTQLHLIDEFQICVHPVILGAGLQLFKQVDKQLLTLHKTKIFKSGQILLYYTPGA